MSKVTLRLNEGGMGTVLLNGEPIDTVAVAITTEVDQPTEVTLVLPPSQLDIEVEVKDSNLHIVRKKLS